MYAPLQNKDYLNLEIQAAIVMELAELQRAHEQVMWDRLKVQLKPSKCVLCTQKITKGKLTLVPATLAVKHASTRTDDIFQVTTPSEDYFWLSATMTIPKAEGDSGFLNPCFLVNTTTTQEEANMHIVFVKSKRVAGGIEVPMLKNFREIREGETLSILREKKRPSAAALELSPQAQKRCKGKCKPSLPAC
jgi:hypothetical protein